MEISQIKFNFMPACCQALFMVRTNLSLGGSSPGKRTVCLWPLPVGRTDRTVVRVDDEAWAYHFHPVTGCPRSVHTVAAAGGEGGWTFYEWKMLFANKWTKKQIGFKWWQIVFLFFYKRERFLEENGKKRPQDECESGLLFRGHFRP